MAWWILLRWQLAVARLHWECRGDKDKDARIRFVSTSPCSIHPSKQMHGRHSRRVEKYCTLDYYYICIVSLLKSSVMIVKCESLLYYIIIVLFNAILACLPTCVRVDSLANSCCRWPGHHRCVHVVAWCACLCTDLHRNERIIWKETWKSHRANWRNRKYKYIVSVVAANDAYIVW